MKEQWAKTLVSTQAERAERRVRGPVHSEVRPHHSNMANRAVKKSTAARLFKLPTIQGIKLSTGHPKQKYKTKPNQRVDEQMTSVHPQADSQPRGKVSFFSIRASLGAGLPPRHSEAPRRAAGSITHLSVSCDMFSLPPRFFLVKLDFQVGAGNRESELPEVGLQVSRLFFFFFFFLPPSPLVSSRLPSPHLPARLPGESVRFVSRRSQWRPFQPFTPFYLRID